MRRLALLMTFLASAALAQEQDAPDANPAEAAMTLQRLQAILKIIDENAAVRGAGVELTIEDVPVLVVADPIADRMRAMVPIRRADGLDAEELMRLMQANFDTALDARYAVAQGRLWGVYIHPLSPLERDQLISGLVQTVNLARSYGQAYSGGAQHFGGGDSGEIYRNLLEKLLDKGQEL